VKGASIRDRMNGVGEAPGKTWFWELEAGVVDAGRCVQCGTCVAVCPSNSIGVSAESSLPELVKMCTGCSLCWDFCPRGGLRAEALWPPSTPSTRNGPATPDAAAAEPDAPRWLTPGPPAEGLGAVVESYAARASAGGGQAQDGGVVTAVLLAALAAGEIDGALVAVPSDDPAEPWRGVARVATTPDEIARSAGSFYNQTMALAALDLSGLDLGDRPRLAVVGTPCEIEGIRAMQARPWPTGAHRVDAVVLTIALLCTKSFDYRTLVLQLLRDERGVDLARVSKVDVVHGRLVVEYADGGVAVDEPVKLFHGAALKGCDECADFVGRTADLSVGSVGSLRGWSSVLVRTERGRRALGAARGRLDLRDLDSPEALERLDRLDKQAAVEALRRPFDPDGPLFVDFAAHVAAYEGSDRAVVVRER
jgi:coenzyme F420 hydrogenase subunit beta